MKGNQTYTDDLAGAKIILDMITDNESPVSIKSLAIARHILENKNSAYKFALDVDGIDPSMSQAVRNTTDGKLNYVYAKGVDIRIKSKESE